MSKKSGEPVQYTFRKVLVIGDDGELCEVNWNDVDPMPGPGELLRARITARVYRDQVEFELDELLPLRELAA